MINTTMMNLNLQQNKNHKITSVCLSVWFDFKKFSQ